MLNYDRRLTALEAKRPARGFCRCHRDDTIVVHWPEDEPVRDPLTGDVSPEPDTICAVCGLPIEQRHIVVAYTDDWRNDDI